jgi:release factor glutamine methyltransferase
MGMKLHVAPGVLIPRPETEELVDLIRQRGRDFGRIMDIGTGSGCIALALKGLFLQAEVYGVEVSEEALRIARRNGIEQGLKVQWEHSDVLAEDTELPGSLDLLVSNPPYVPRAEEPELEAHVRDHEPHLALFVDDADPLLFYRVIATKGLSVLVPGGELWFEGHYNHAVEVGVLLGKLGYEKVEVLNDLSGSARFIHAIR